MQVILMEKVANLGDLGDVVKVKDGFARNFLIPHGKAKRATRREPARSSRRAAPSWKRRRPRRSTKAQERAREARGPEARRSAQKAGVDGRLFGSVTNYDIVEALEKQGHEVERAQGPHAAGAAQAGGRFPDRRSRCTPTSTVTITVSVLGEQ